MTFVFDLVSASIKRHIIFIHNNVSKKYFNWISLVNKLKYLLYFIFNIALKCMN